jgi:hypothetical protein
MYSRVALFQGVYRVFNALLYGSSVGWEGVDGGEKGRGIVIQLNTLNKNETMNLKFRDLYM